MSKKIIYKKKEYELVGECKKCGDCCRIKFQYFHINGGSGELEFGGVVKRKISVCESLNNNLCMIHESNKPKICKIFPSFYQELELLPLCGFSWKLIRENVEKDDTIVYLVD